MNKVQAKENLSKLLVKYERESSTGEAADYNEEATKTAFIQPLLKDVLGWDVTDRNEVSPEYKVSRKRVDYGLKIGGSIKLFVEAKPINADLDKHIEQAVKYGYNRRDVSFVVLTNFKETMLFDVTFKPDPRNHKKGLKLSLSAHDYLEKFDALWALSRESAATGALDKLLTAKPKDRRTVDKDILDDLKKWREALAKDIYKNNPALFKVTHDRSDSTPHPDPLPQGARESDNSKFPLPFAGEDKGEGGDSLSSTGDYLKEITQRLLDRIIFIRFSEDRNLMHRPTLREIFESRADDIGPKAMLFLKPEFKEYDRVFNSDLFSPKPWEDGLAVDFKVMKSIINGVRLDLLNLLRV